MATTSVHMTIWSRPRLARQPRTVGDPRRVGDDAGRVARAPRRDPVGHGAPLHPLDGGDDLEHARGLVAADVEGAGRGRGVVEQHLRGRDVGLGEVLDVDVVAQAGPVRRRPVVAVDGHRLARLGRPHHQRQQVRRAPVGQLRRRGPGHVEVAQRGPAQTRGVGVAAHRPLPRELGLAVGARRERRVVLGDRLRARLAVDRGARGVDDPPDPRRGHGPQQRDGAADVLLVVVQRHRDRLGHRLLRGEVHHPVERPPRGQSGEHGGQVRVEQARAQQLDVVGEALGQPRREVVHHDGVVAGRAQRTHHVGADVAGPSGQQPGAHGADPNEPPRPAVGAPAADVVRPRTSSIRQR